jgi:hypothetical protein
LAAQDPGMKRAWLISIALATAGTATFAASDSLAPSNPVTPARQAIEDFVAADSLRKAGDPAAAKAVLNKAMQLPGTPEYLADEARQRLGQIDGAAAESKAGQDRLPPLPPPGLTLHVSPNGDDSSAGDERHPLASLQGARDRLRTLRKANAIPAGTVLVVVHGGEYPVKSTLALMAEDSATEQSPVVFRGAPGERPRFVGGVRLHGFKPVSDPETRRRLPAGAAGHVREADLRRAGIDHLLPLELGGVASGRNFITHPAHELFFNGEAMRLARGPNEGFLQIADVAVRDGTKGYDREGSMVGKFYYRGDRPNRWAGEPDLLLYGYWFWDWADSYERVESIDTKNRLITLSKPWHKYGYSIGAHFYAVNALSELDAPGEFYLDRRKALLFFYPPSDPEKAAVELSVWAEPMVTLDQVSDVRFENLCWELGCHDAIHVAGGSNCFFAGCVIRRFAGNGILIDGGWHNGLLSCDIYSMGRGGVILRGGNRKTLTPAGHLVENCDIHHLSRIDHTYTPAIAIGGVGMHIAHNRLHDVLSSALNVGGNDHLLEYNEVFNAVLESDDQGGADMYGDPTFRGNVYRFNYWHDIGGKNASGPRIKCGQAAVRLDDAISGTLVYGNVFERCSAAQDDFGAVQINGGKDNIIDNNVFIDCSAAISVGAWEEDHWREWTAPRMTNDQIDLPLYLSRYPALASINGNVTSNAVYRNILIRCGELLRHPPKQMDCWDNTNVAHAKTPLARNDPVLNRPGFARIPVEEFGLYQDSLRQKIAAEKER